VTRLLLDTNVVVRFLLGESSPQGQAAAKLFARSDRKEVALVLDPLVLAETLFVLTSVYKKDRTAVAATLETLLQSPGVECGNRSMTLRALQLYKTHAKIHWVDCFVGAASAEVGFPVASFDTDFDRLDGVTRCDPATLG